MKLEIGMAELALGKNETGLDLLAKATGVMHHVNS